MNKKGFTTIELIISFVMVAIMLASLIGFTITYRDRVKKEEIKSQLLDFKNTVTKAVYDDIITYNYVSMTPCVGQDNCVVMVDERKSEHTLKIENSCDGGKCGVYLVYNEERYMLPDSDLNKYDNNKVIESASNLTSFELKTYRNNIYNLKMVFEHFQMSEKTEIMLTIN